MRVSEAKAERHDRKQAQAGCFPLFGWRAPNARTMRYQ
jgi:hypothetical protein